jgi:hypothetical protein
VIDITDSQNPQIAGSVDTPTMARGVAVSSTFAYVAGGDLLSWMGFLWVIDVMSPQSPLIVGTVYTPEPAWDIAVSGAFAYLAEQADVYPGLQVIDITNPQNPLIVGSLATPNNAFRVAVWGTCAYVAAQQSLQVIDITNPQNPQIAGSATCRAVVLAVSGTLIYCGTNDLELQVLPTQCPSSSGVREDHGVVATIPLRALPNPSSGQTEFRFDTRNRGMVRANVYDSAGRLVRRLSSGAISAGPHYLLWDGRDDQGHQVAPGVYLARVTTPEGTRTARLVVVK